MVSPSLSGSHPDYNTLGATWPPFFNQMQIHLTLKSTNVKTGPIPVSTSSRDTCPQSCPWYKRGCYANGGPLRIHWNKVSNASRGTSELSTFLGQIERLPPGTLWRHNQAGDLPGEGQRINHHELRSLAKASAHTRGFTYTHKPVLGDDPIARKNRTIIARYNTQGFVINLSGNGLEDADKLYRLRIAPVTTVLPSNFEGRTFVTPGGVRGIVCPATYRDDITCSSCPRRSESEHDSRRPCLCAIPNRSYIIGFPAHGAQKRELDTKLNR